MSESTQLLKRMQQTRIVVVIRGSQTIGLMTLAGDLAALGLDVHEITMTTPGALACIEELRSSYPDVLVGAGTVLDENDARDAIKAGAQFLVSPTLDRDVIAVAKANDAMAIPGALTPTEIYQAWCAGADIVKIFPASMGGPAYIRAVKGPLPDVPLLPTGGINVDNACEYLDAGAVAACLGTSFVQPAALKSGDFRATLDSAVQLMERLQGAYEQRKVDRC